LTSAHIWDPKVLDSTVKDDWYDDVSKEEVEQMEQARDETPYDGFGGLKSEAPIDYDDDGLEDRLDKSVDRGTIKAFYAHIIDKELQHDFKVCNIEGVLHDIRGWDDEETDAEQTIGTQECFPVSTRSKSKDAVKVKPTQQKLRKRKDDKPDDSEEHVTVETIDDEESESEDDEPSFFNNQARDTAERISSEEEPILEAGPRLSHPHKKNVAEYSKYFPGTDHATLKKTFDATTQYGTRGATDGHSLRNQIQSPNPILNIPRRHEEVATDTL
jgi:hypothetical protein